MGLYAGTPENFVNDTCKLNYRDSHDNSARCGHQDQNRFANIRSLQQNHLLGDFTHPLAGSMGMYHAWAFDRVIRPYKGSVGALLRMIRRKVPAA